MYHNQMPMNVLQMDMVNGMKNMPKDETQIPMMPIMGPKTFDEILQDIAKAIVDESTAAEFYSRLMKQAPNALHREFIDHAYEDERSHRQNFMRLYKYYTNKLPQYSLSPIQYPSYKDGILQALKGEIEAAEFYRDVQLSTADQLIKDTFYLAMIDEMGHATQFSTLYNTLRDRM